MHLPIWNAFWRLFFWWSEISIYWCDQSDGPWLVRSWIIYDGKFGNDLLSGKVPNGRELWILDEFRWLCCFIPQITFRLGIHLAAYPKNLICAQNNSRKFTRRPSHESGVCCRSFWRETVQNVYGRIKCPVFWTASHQTVVVYRIRTMIRFWSQDAISAHTLHEINWIYYIRYLLLGVEQKTKKSKYYPMLSTDNVQTL